MKKIFLIFILYASALSAQSEQKSIELPDFVITGRQSVDLPTMQKKKPELISTISKDFLLPQYSPDELPLLISSLPVPSQPKIFTNDYFDGSVKVGIGNYTFPTGTFHLSKSFGYYVVSADAWGKNIKEYVPNSGYNTSGVSLNNVLFISTKSGFLPGTEIKLNGNYVRDAYKFYASNSPAFERKTQKGFGNLSISNNYNRWFDFAAGFGLNTLSFDESGLKERVINANMLLDFKLNGFVFGGKGEYNKQILDNNFNDKKNYDFYTAEGFIKAELNNKLLLRGGVYYAANGNQNLFAPFASAQLEIQKGLTLSAEYKPHAQNYTYADMLKKNLYLGPTFTDNVFERYKVEFNASLKYEYYKYFSISLSGSYSKVDGYLYFEDNINKGIFEIQTAQDVDNFYTSLDMLFRPAQLGYFYGVVKYGSVKNNNSYYIPYEPRIYSSLIYGYDFNFGLGLKIKFDYADEVFTDIKNTNKLNDYQNLSFGLSYKLWESLSFTADFQNILNRSNFVINGYEEKPFDIIVGAEYRW